MASTELKGFILTRRWRDTPAGTEIEYWLATDAGPRKVVLTAQTSVAFLQVKHRSALEAQLLTMPELQIHELELRTFRQEPVIGVYAKQHRQIGRLARALAAQNVPLYEADVRPHDRYLMERFITAGVLVEGGRPEGATIVDCKLKPAPHFRPVLKVAAGTQSRSTKPRPRHHIEADSDQRSHHFLGEGIQGPSEGLPFLSLRIMPVRFRTTIGGK